MIRRSLIGMLWLSALAGLLVGSQGIAVAAPKTWSGRTFAFAKAAFADPTLPANQDRITPLVWLTRATTNGIFNIQSETGYTGEVSPAGTEWATGDAVDYANLTFQPWELWANKNPPATVGVNAVVHLIDEDIYIDIVFDSWGQGHSGGGGEFSYRRAVDPSTPTLSTSWGSVKALYR